LFCTPAMGVPASKYRKLGQSLASRNIIFVVADLRGHGTSSIRASRKNDYGYDEMLNLDMCTAVTTLKARYPNRPLYLVGHSLGGQLSCLYAAAGKERVAGVVLVAACSVYYRHFGRVKYGLRFLFTLVRPVVTCWGYFPGKRLGFAGREATRVMRDWTHQGRTGKYQILNNSCDYETHLARMQHPLLALSFAEDTFAPQAAVTHLTQKMRQAEVTQHHVTLPRGESQKSTHFTWLYQPDPVADRIESWLRDRP